MARSGTDPKKKVVRVAEGPRAPGFARTLGETLGMCVRPLFPLTMLVVIYAGVSYLLWRPLNGAADDSEFAARARLTSKTLNDAIRSQKHGAWIAEQDLRQLAATGVFTGKNQSVFEPGLARKLAAAYERDGWVERVRAVRLRYPAQLEVELDFRRPCARLDNGAVLDRQGVALNLSAGSPYAANLPVLAGVAQRVPIAGRACAEHAVNDALDLLAVVRDSLAQCPGNLRIVRVEQSDGRWTVSTQNGPKILWGAFTDDPPLGEPRTGEKAQLLRRRIAESGNPSMLEFVKVYVAQAPVKPRENAEIVPVPVQR
jgi:hypothetical protein